MSSDVLRETDSGAWTLPAGFKVGAKQPPGAAPTNTSAADRRLCRDERPSLREVFRRHRNLTDRKGRPYWLPHHRFLYPEEADERPAWNPSGCLGPLRKGQPMVGKRRYLCDQVHFCAFCWERRCRQSGLWAAIHHAGEENAVSFSVSLPGVSANPELCREARSKLARALRRHGFDRITLWVHTFGENPVEGAKGHLDGFASGSAADLDILDTEHSDVLRRVLLPFHERPEAGFWRPHVHHRLVNQSNAKRNVRDLVLGGFYSGRPTFPTRRVLAGMYSGDAVWRVRLTNVTRKSKARDVQDMTDRLGRPVPDWTFLQTMDALKTAEEWKQSVGRPLLPRGVTVRRPVLQAILDDARWRTFFRLTSDRDLVERYGS